VAIVDSKEVNKLIKYKDFAPQPSAWGPFGGSTEVESFSAVVSAMNQWIEHNSIQVINTETVVLPKNSSQGMDEGLYKTNTPYEITNWFQCVRVWYRE
jgi:pectin methylesterase-like acyl-CoA thioesterase